MPLGERSGETRRGHAVVLTALATSVMVAWSFVIPIFESPDEPHHWAYATYLREHAKLPTLEASFQTAYHPPAYYLLIAAVAAPTPVPPPAAWGDVDGLSIPFPPRLLHNSNADFARYWPIRVARLLTVLISAVTVWFCYLAGREAGAGSRESGLLTAGLVGFMPGFSFRGMSVSNDALVTCFCAAAVWLLVRIVRQGFSWKDGVWATVAIGAAYLTKISAICMAPPLFIVVLGSPAPWTTRLRRTIVLTVALFAIVAPWSIRNIVYYGDPFLATPMRTFIAGLLHPTPITSPYFRDEFPRVMFESFVGLYGWMNFLSPAWVYSLYFYLAIVAGLGWIVRWVRRDVSWPVAAVLVSVVLLNLAIVVHLNLSYRQPQGRYMFPALAAVAALAALGLEGWLPRRPMRLAMPAKLAVVYGFAVVNIYLLTTWIRPGYWPGVTADLSHQEMALNPTPTPSPLRASGDGAFQLRYCSVRTSLPVSLQAENLPFLEFELTSDQVAAPLTGAVYFGESVDGSLPAQQVPFRWRPSGPGLPQRIIVAMSPNLEWRGCVERLVIAPAEEPPDTGPRVSLTNVRLRNNLAR